ncbi:P-loop NTPase [Candidatus Woesearchaeota archaeon]|nr:P-loop NTPase [Candidatus Woesearchaeota archaeon]
MTKFILIASGKGGAGKTSCTINLASALSYFNKDVILVDANLNNPNLSLNLGLINTSRNMQDVLLGKYHILESLYHLPSGLRIAPLSISTSYIGKTNFNNLKKSLYGLDGLTDYVLIDAPSGNNYETIHLINSVDEIIIVVNPETSCLTDALKTIRIANYYEKPIKGIIINKASQNDFFTEADIKLLLKNDILGIIHNDDNLKLSNHYKDSIVNLYPFSQSSLDFKKLASNLVNEYYEVESHKKSFFSKIFRK